MVYSEEIICQICRQDHLTTEHICIFCRQCGPNSHQASDCKEVCQSMTCFSLEPHSIAEHPVDVPLLLHLIVTRT